MSIFCPYPSCLTPGGQQRRFYLQPRCIEHCRDIHHGVVVVDEFNNIVFNHMGVPLIKGFNQLVVVNAADPDDVISVNSNNHMVVVHDDANSVHTTVIVPKGPFSGSNSTSTRKSERLVLKNDTASVSTISSIGITSFNALSIEEKTYLYEKLVEKRDADKSVKRKADKAAKRAHIEMDEIDI